MKYDLFSLKTELSKLDIYINDVYDLVNTSKSYGEAIPILIKFMQQYPINDAFKEGLIRSLAVKEAIGKAGWPLLQEFLKMPNDKLLMKWAIANSLSVVMTVNEVNDVLIIVTNKEHGIARQPLILGLSRFKTPDVEDVVIKVLDDEAVAISAIESLYRMKSEKGIKKIKTFTEHTNKGIRKSAIKVISKLA